MPTTSELSIGIDTKDILAVQNENIKIDSNLLENQELQNQKKKLYNQSPRRKNSNNNNRSVMNNNNVAPNSRRNQGFQKRHNINNNNNNNETNKQSMYKQQSNQQQKLNMNANGLPPTQQQESSKKSQKSYHRSAYKTHNGNYHYELHTDSTSAPPSLADNDYLSRQQMNSPGDSQDVPRKYSKNFLHTIAYKMNSPLKEAEELSLRMALGDNSQYFNHFVAGQFVGNQLMLPQQQQQQYYQSYHRYNTQQHLQMQRVQRSHQPSSNYNKMQYDQDQQLPCNCPQTSIPHARNVQYCYQNSPNYSNQQNKRDYRYGDKNKNNRQYSNGHHNINNNQQRAGFLEKSQSFNEEDNRRSSRSYQQPLNNNQLEIQTYRSLSPTPPSSSKSSSPGVQEKCLETTDDTASTASGSSSVQGFFNESNLKSPSTISLSAPILVQPDYHAANNVSYWIDNSNKLHNGHSVSAEEIHNMQRDTQTFKRPVSLHGGKRIQILKHNTAPYSESFDIFDVHMKHCMSSEIVAAPKNLVNQSSFDLLSMEMWKKFTENQQASATYQKKIEIWRDLYNSLKVSEKCHKLVLIIFSLCIIILQNLPLFHQLAYPKWGLFMVGSTITGFGANSSDVDMCFVIKGPPPRHDPRSEAIMTLHDLKNHLAMNRGNLWI